MNRRSLGREYEEKAAAYLREKGMKILVHSFRCRRGEVDLVARDGVCLVFVEVKFRSTAASGLPEEAVSPAKMRTISRVADFYRLRWRVTDDVPCRFDVIAIEGESIRHYPDAFPYFPCR